MTVQLPHSRNRLEWYRFDQVGSGGWELILPDFYARLFAQQEPVIMEKSNGDFHCAPDHAGQRICFDDLATDDIAAVERFISDFRRFVVLGLTSRLRSCFSDELDWCVALDYNAESPEQMSQYKRTPIGQLEYRAKYEESERAVTVLARHMVVLLDRIGQSFALGEVTLSYIPPGMGKQFDLPRELVRAVGHVLISRATHDPPPTVVRPTLMVNKPDLKRLVLSDKIAAWRSLKHSNAIRLSHPVTDRTVVVIDDLYQSGATLWSYAGYLKSLGATTVIGMVCVKSRRDTDNL